MNMHELVSCVCVYKVEVFLHPYYIVKCESHFPCYVFQSSLMVADKLSEKAALFKTLANEKEALIKRVSSYVAIMLYALKCYQMLIVTKYS